ncbi:MAG: hypothetical protein WC242_00585 [Candidatus Paceibacterota bacterium]|jgi:hypothetical protein
MAKGDDGPVAPGTPLERAYSQLRLMEIKERDLMNVTERIIDQCRNSPAFGPVSEKVFVLFERAKQIDRATTEDELSAAVEGIGKI